MQKLHNFFVKFPHFQGNSFGEVAKRDVFRHEKSHYGAFLRFLTDVFVYLLQFRRVFCVFLIHRPPCF